MHPDIKILFTYRPDDPIEVVAADLLKVVTGDMPISHVVGIWDFVEDTEDPADPDRIDRLWEFFKNHARNEAFMDAFYMCGRITLDDIACEYLTHLLTEHRHDLEMIVSLKKD